MRRRELSLKMILVMMAMLTVLTMEIVVAMMVRLMMTTQAVTG